MGNGESSRGTSSGRSVAAPRSPNLRKGTAMGQIPPRSGRTAIRRRQAWYRPRLEILEARLPPGDALLGVLVAGALLAPAFADGETELGTLGLDGGEERSAALVSVAQPERSAA